MKFKVGDRVKIVNCRVKIGPWVQNIGYVGTIKEISKNSIGELGYKINGCDFRWYDDELELVAKSKFYHDYTILEFEDFDWSDFMNKTFTKKDLKNGDVVKISDDTIGIICLETNTIIYKDGYDRVSELTKDLKFEYSSCGARIIAVRRPLVSRDCSFDAFDEKLGKIVYEEKEVEEMTLEEVCKALGKEIKIVKK